MRKGRDFCFVQFFHDFAQFSVPECPNNNEVEKPTKLNSVCRMSALDNCGENQMCIQEKSDGDEGTCQCRAGYVNEDDAKCVPKTQSPHLQPPEPRRPKAAVDVASPSVQQPEPEGEPEDASEGSSATAAIVVSLLVVVALFGVAAFIVLRTRLAPRLRARLTRTPYDDMAIRAADSQQNVIA